MDDNDLDDLPAPVRKFGGGWRCMVCGRYWTADNPYCEYDGSPGPVD